MKIRPENHDCFLTFLMDYFGDREGVEITVTGKGISFNYENDASYVTEEDLDEVLEIWNHAKKKSSTSD